MALKKINKKKGRRIIKEKRKREREKRKRNKENMEEKKTNLNKDCVGKKIKSLFFLFY